jgi:hypothetical protein
MPIVRTGQLVSSGTINAVMFQAAAVSGGRSTGEPCGPDGPRRFASEPTRLQPTPGFMRLVKDRVLSAWRDMQSDARQRIAEIERKQKSIREKLDRLDQAFLSTGRSTSTRTIATANPGVRRARSTERGEPLGPVVVRSEAAPAAGVFSGRDSLRRENACWNRHDPAGFQLLEPDFGREKRFGGPDFSQMEPTDQLDASNRRLPESRLERFAKRRSAFRPSSFFLANPRASITSSIERLGCCWLSPRCFGASQGQSWGQSARVPTRWSTHGPRFTDSRDM